MYWYVDKDNVRIFIIEMIELLLKTNRWIIVLQIVIGIVVPALVLYFTIKANNKSHEQKLETTIKNHNESMMKIKSNHYIQLKNLEDIKNSNKFSALLNTLLQNIMNLRFELSVINNMSKNERILLSRKLVSLVTMKNYYELRAVNSIQLDEKYKTMFLQFVLITKDLNSLISHYISFLEGKVIR